jgi:hypothetical protein
MSSTKTKLIITFVFLGFFAGSLTYSAINWLIVNNVIQIPVLREFLSSPWMISGLAGSVLSVICITVFSMLARRE